MVAATADEVVVALRADLGRYTSEITRASQLFDQNMTRIERRGARAANATRANFNGIGRDIGRSIGAVVGAAAIKTFTDFADSATKVRNSLRIAGLEGDQLTRVYGELFESAQRNRAPLETLAELYSRLSLSAKELGINSDEAVNFIDGVGKALLITGKSAAEARGALLQLGQAVGNGVVRAEEFNSIAEGALPILQAVATGLTDAGGSVARLRELVIDGKVSSEAFFRAFEAGKFTLDDLADKTTPTLGQELLRLNNQFIDTAGVINDTLGINAALGSGVAGLTEITKAFGDAVLRANQIYQKFNTTLSLPFDDTEDILDRLLNKVTELGERARQFIRDSLPEGLVTDATPTPRPRRGVGGGSASSQFRPPPEPVSLSDFAPPPRRGNGRRRESPFDRETRQIQERTRALDLERQTLGQSQFEQDRARANLELHNAATQQGIVLTTQQRIEVDRLAFAYAEAAEATRQAETRQQAINDLQREFGALAIDSISGLIDGTKSLNDVLADTLKRLAQLALQAAILGDGPLGGLFGLQGSGGAAGGLVGALFGGFRANGGGVQSGRGYVVGERGPELFLPGRSGSVVSNRALARQQAPSSGNLVVNADLRDSSAPSIAVLQNRIDRLERNLPGIVQKAQTEGRRNQPFYGG